MPISHPISVGDGVRIDALLDTRDARRSRLTIDLPDELVGHFGTVEQRIDAWTFDVHPVYLVRTSLDGNVYPLLDVELTLTRRARYDVDDVVELYPEPTHEGPHPDDEHTLVRVARVLDVHLHPNNDEWVVGYTVEEHLPVSSPDEPEPVDVHRVERGAIARLHARETSS